jgi:hypothetical protein
VNGFACNNDLRNLTYCDKEPISDKEKIYNGIELTQIHCYAVILRASLRKFRAEDGSGFSTDAESARFSCPELHIQRFVEVSAYIITYTMFIENTAITQEANVSKTFIRYGSYLIAVSFRRL